ncbi:alpha/beta fold hydrolase [Olivibacter sp. SDN3]|uniref:alpha/beta hydrolase n=1 Tax=Olivibacter sp. SDN3 TaxID=2764720 RepID=UPI00165131E3|nr:alpha/beta fold hydrolase [Olivibacter sp. SDN3]QNL51681.1 alpha/beta fold hydrolase [Olivibacter sp. SDN3]
MWKKVLFIIVCSMLGLYVLVCGLLYFFQEKLIFFPEKLDNDFKFSFDDEYEELNIKTADGKLLNGLLFKTAEPKGLIFYLHGNAGSLNSWGTVAKTYTDLSYDLFILDYRGYGKSEGSISGQDQLFGDVQGAYDELKQKYEEKDIVVLGYSVGTGPAAKLASTNNPGLLILQTPYYSLTDLVKRMFPLLPTTILKYKFETNSYLQDAAMPIVIFHGDRDKVIYYESSVKLKNDLGEKVNLITLPGQGHNGLTDNPDYLKAIKKILK